MRKLIWLAVSVVAIETAVVAFALSIPGDMAYNCAPGWGMNVMCIRPN